MNMKATKKLIGASVALAVAASLTVGSTFAWFSYQSNVELAEVGFAVDSGDENLQVAVTTVGGSTANSDFVYSLSADTIKSKINGGNPISYTTLTVAEDTGNTVAATNPINLLEKKGTAASALEYAAFDLVFRYIPSKDTSTMPSLVLDYGSEVTADPDDATFNPTRKIYAWENLTTAKYGIATEVQKDAVIKARARDAARVAFIFGDETTKTNKVWAPSEEISGSVTTSDTAKGFYKGNLASDYAISQHVTTDAVTAPTYANRIYAGIATPAQASDFDDSSIVQFTAPGSGVTYTDLRVTVKVWLEGKDGDCIESVLGDTFKFLLKFRTSTLKSVT